jgi:hypothetical protein
MMPRRAGEGWLYLASESSLTQAEFDLIEGQRLVMRYFPISSSSNSAAAAVAAAR